MKNILLLIVLFFISSNLFSQQNTLHFDGFNDYVVLDSIAPEMVGLEEFTFEGWIKPSLIQNDEYGMIFSSNSISVANDLNRFVLRLSGPADVRLNTITLNIPDSTTFHKITGITNVMDGNCHHVAWTYNRGLSILYIDGIPQDSMIHFLSFENTDRFSMGQEYDPPGFTSSDFFRGSLDECRIWGIELSQSQIAESLNKEISPIAEGLIAYYRFNQGIGGAENDSITRLTNLVDFNHAGILRNFRLTDTTSNFIEAECDIEKDSTVNIRSYEENSNTYILFPNPAENFVYLSTNNIGLAQVQVINSIGQVIINLNADFHDGISKIEISHLNTGNYFIRILPLNSDQIAVKKLIIIK